MKHESKKRHDAPKRKKVVVLNPPCYQHAQITNNAFCSLFPVNCSLLYSFLIPHFLIYSLLPLTQLYRKANDLIKIFRCQAQVAV